MCLMLLTLRMSKIWMPSKPVHGEWRRSAVRRVRAPALARRRTRVGPLRRVDRAEHEVLVDADVALGADAREVRPLARPARVAHVDDAEAVVAALDDGLLPERQIGVARIPRNRAGPGRRRPEHRARTQASGRPAPCCPCAVAAGLAVDPARRLVRRRRRSGRERRVPTARIACRSAWRTSSQIGRCRAVPGAPASPWTRRARTAPPTSSLGPDRMRARPMPQGGVRVSRTPLEHLGPDTALN